MILKTEKKKHIIFYYETKIKDLKSNVVLNKTDDNSYNKWVKLVEVGKINEDQKMQI